MKNFQTDLICSACGLIDEKQLHLMQCQILTEYDNENTHDTNHKEIYSSDIKLMFTTTSLMKNRMNIVN